MEFLTEEWMTESMQALGFDTAKRLFKGLTDIIVTAREQKRYTTKELMSTGISNLILKETGLNVVVIAGTDASINAWAVPPDLKQNHALIAGPFQEYYNGKGAVKQLSKFGGRITGQVDDVSGTVNGDLSKIKLKIGITGGALRGPSERAEGKSLEEIRALSSTLYPEEAAALLLHELGHLWSYFRYMTVEVWVNQVLSTAFRAVSEAKEDNVKIALYKNAKEALGVEVDVESLVAADQQETYLVFSRAHQAKMRSSTGGYVYDMTSYESLSDQFATRHGAGKYLSTGLNKIHRMTWDAATLNTFQHVALQGVLLMSMIGVSVLVPAIGVYIVMILIALGRPDADTYDTATVRLKRIKEQMIDQLKHGGEQSIAEEITVVDAIIQELNDKRSFYEFLFTTFIPTGRAERKQRDFQRKLEELTHTDLAWMQQRLGLTRS